MASRPGILTWPLRLIWCFLVVLLVGLASFVVGVGLGSALGFVAAFVADVSGWVTSWGS